MNGVYFFIQKLDYQTQTNTHHILNILLVFTIYRCFSLKSSSFTSFSNSKDIGY